MKFLMCIRNFLKKNRILIVTLLMLNILLVLLGILGNMILVNEVFEKNIEKGISRSIESVNDLDNMIYLGENIVDFVERDYRYMKKLPGDPLSTKDLVNETFKMINENSSYFYNLYIAYDNKILGTKDERYENSNPVGREWYDLAVSRGELVITNPYEDIITGERIITISKKVKDIEQCVVGLDIKQNEINAILNKITRDQDSISFGFVLNRDGVFVGHTNELFIGRTIFDETIDKQELIAPYIEDLLMKESGRIDFDSMGFPYSLIYQSTESNWHVVYVVDKTYMSPDTNSYRSNLVITYIICVVLLNTIILVYYLKRQKAIRLQMRAEHAEKELIRYKEDLEMMVEAKTEKIKFQSEKLRTLNTAIIDNLADIVEFRDLESGQHIKRIKKFTYFLAIKIAELYPEYELNEEKIDLLCKASALHDIGKIGIADSILLKPGKLTKEEFEEMKKHTIIGDDLALKILDKYDKELAKFGHEICRYHHERYDGRGYPDGLKGDQIPICAQIVSIADVYDALIEKRVYKEAFSHERAIQMINNGECGIFSPKLLHCLNLVEVKFYNISKMYQ